MNVLTDKEVAFHCGVSLHTLRQGRVRHNLNVPAHVKLENGRVRYEPETVSAWCAANGIVPHGPLQTLEDSNV